MIVNKEFIQIMRLKDNIKSKINDFQYEFEDEYKRGFDFWSE